MPLHTLYCSSNAVHDLTPLRGMALTLCYCVFNALRELAPLEGMPLQKLLCAGNRITDLSPLRAMPLTVLGCLGNAISDLSPLAGLPLETLSCGVNPVTSLRPLRGMPLEILDITGIPLTPDNVQVLLELPLRELTCDRTDAALALRHSHPTLQRLLLHAPGVSCLTEKPAESILVRPPSSAPPEPRGIAAATLLLPEFSPAPSPPAQPTSSIQVSIQVHPETARLLINCTGTLSQQELMKKLGLRNRPHFSAAYIRPALDTGYLERTIPDKPHSSKQHYRLTAQGRAWVQERVSSERIHQQDAEISNRGLRK
jgi:hypothetical protein